MRKVQFEEFEIDLKRFTLHKGKKAINIGPRTLDLLVCLIENRDRVVDQEFLRREVWNATALSPAAIPTCVLELRRALGDDSKHPRFIESVRGRGYRFVAKLRNSTKSQRRLKQPLDELPFVGRTQEINTIRQVVRTSITQASGRLVLIRGEAGIGKSRLLAHVLDLTKSDIRQHIAHGSHVQGTPSFWSWTQIVREVLTSPTTSNPKLIENAQALAGSFPEIVNATNPFLTRSGDIDRFSILSLWARTIRSISPSVPILLAFEDIHRADLDSLSLLAWLAEELSSDPILVLATHRPSAELSETARALSQLASVGGCVTIDLPPLSEKEISSFLDPLDVERDHVGKLLHLRTSGNPFYVTHLIRYLDSQSDFGSAESLIRALPSNGREIVARQLSDLPRATRNALSAASVAGHTFSIPTTASALNISSAELVCRLEPARLSWLVRDEGDEYAFTHDLLCEALYQTLNAQRRRQLHLDIAETLINQPSPERNAAQISEHLTRSAPLADPKSSHQFAVLAGRAAAARFAYGKSQLYFRRALDISGTEKADQPRERCKTTLEYARSQLLEGKRIDARSTLLAAADLARSTGASDLLAECALSLAPDYLSIIIGAYDLTLVQLIEEALHQTAEDNLSLRSRLMARLSQALQWSGDRNNQANLTIKALDLARRSNDDETLAAALSARVEYLRGPAQAEERLDVLTELQEVSSGTCNVAELLLQKTQIITASLELGDLRKLDAQNEACRELARQTELPHLMWYSESTDSMRDMMRGDFRENHELTKRYNEVQRLTRDENVSQEYAGQQFYRQLELDQSKAVLPFISEFAQQHDSVLTWLAAYCWMQWDAKDDEAACETLSRLGPSGIEAQSQEAGGGIGIAGLAEVAANLGDQPTRKQLYRILQPIKHRFASAGYGWVYFGSFARYSGLLAGSLDHHADAIADLELAVKMESRLGASVWRGHARIDLIKAAHAACRPDVQVSSYIESARTSVNFARSPRLARRFREALEVVGAE